MAMVGWRHGGPAVGDERGDRAGGPGPEETPIDARVRAGSAMDGGELQVSRTNGGARLHLPIWLETVAIDWNQTEISDRCGVHGGDRVVVAAERPGLNVDTALLGDAKGATQQRVIG